MTKCKECGFHSDSFQSVHRVGCSLDPLNPTPPAADIILFHETGDPTIHKPPATAKDAVRYWFAVVSNTRQEGVVSRKDRAVQYEQNVNHLKLVEASAYDRVVDELAELEQELSFYVTKLQQEEARSAKLLSALKLVEPWLSRLSGCIGDMSDANLSANVCDAIREWEGSK